MGAEPFPKEFRRPKSRVPRESSLGLATRPVAAHVEWSTLRGSNVEGRLSVTQDPSHMTDRTEHEWKMTGFMSHKKEGMYRKKHVCFNHGSAILSRFCPRRSALRFQGFHSASALQRGQPHNRRTDADIRRTWMRTEACKRCGPSSSRVPCCGPSRSCFPTAAAATTLPITLAAHQPRRQSSVWRSTGSAMFSTRTFATERTRATSAPRILRHLVGCGG